MKTLKKVLCLVLALVMVVGTMAISAAAFTDDKDITNKDAAAVLNGIKVIEGYEDKSFRPEGTLTRAEGATIIYKLLQATDVKLTSKLTDAKGHWSENAVAYCESEGIVAGYGDGTFGVNDKLTAAQFAKMILVALGYKADVEGFVGADWENNVIKAATAAKINVKGAAWSEAIIRENAAQMAFNALGVSKVRYSGGSTIEINGAKISSGATRTDTNETLADDFGLDLDVVKGVDEETGRPIKTYKRTTADDIVVFETPVATHTGAVTLKQLKADVGVKESADLGVKYYLDGNLTDEADFADEINNGAVVEVYGDKNGVTVVAFNEHVYTLNADDIVKANAAKEIKAGIMVNGKKFNTEDAYAKDDVIVYTVGKTSVLTVATATISENLAVTKIAGSSYTVGGKSYKVLDGTDVAALGTISAGTNKNYTVDIWTDANGLIVLADVHTEAADPAVYAVVVKAAQEGASAGLDAEAGKYSVRLRSFTDGKTVDYVGTAKDLYYALEGKIVTYTVNDKGVITLTEVVDDTETKTTLKEITGELGATVAVTDGVTANAKTIYLLGVKNAKGEVEYKVVIGYRNVPALKEVSGTVVAVNGVAKYVYVSTSETKTTVDNSFKSVIIATTSRSAVISDTDYAGYVEVKAVVDGEIKTIKVKAADAVQFAALAENSKGVYEAKAGKSFTVKDGTQVSSNNTTVTYADDVLTVGDAKLALSSSAKIYIEKDKDIKAATADDLKKIENVAVNYWTVNGQVALIVVSPKVAS